MRLQKSTGIRGVLLWDIDGTLIQIIRPNSISPHHNVLYRQGVIFNEARVELSGFTDYEVFLELVNKPHELSEAQLRRIFHQLDEESLKLDEGSVFNLHPGVPAILDSLASFGWAHGILTGNTEARMASKLKKSEISNYFTEEFLFSCNFGDSRKDIAQKARNLLKYKYNLRACILGDTPRDIYAAQLHNFPVISIATGIFSATELANCNPDLIIGNLMDDADLLLEFLESFSY